MSRPVRVGKDRAFLLHFLTIFGKFIHKIIRSKNAEFGCFSLFRETESTLLGDLVFLHHIRCMVEKKLEKLRRKTCPKMKYRVRGLP